MTKTMDHNLKKGACLILKSALASNGWYADKKDSTKLICGAVGLMENRLCDIKEEKPHEGEKQEDYSERIKSTMSEVLTFPFTEQERASAKECISWCIRKGMLPVNSYTVNLIEELEVE